MTLASCLLLRAPGLPADPTSGWRYDLHQIHRAGVEPALRDLGLEPQVQLVAGYTPHDATALITQPLAVVDCTGADPALCYQLGLRHAARPAATLLIHAGPCALPPTIRDLPRIAYDCGSDGRLDEPEAERLRALIADAVGAIQTALSSESHCDSPLYRAVPSLRRPELESSVEPAPANDRSATLARLAACTTWNLDAQAWFRALEPLESCRLAELDELVAITARCAAWDVLLALIERSQALPVCRELLSSPAWARPHALALIQVKRVDDALVVLGDLVAHGHGDGEIHGLIGRIHKDRWSAALAAGQIKQAQTALTAAIAAYDAGFAAEPRDPYPGINACILRRVGGTAAADLDDQLAAVRYAVALRERRGVAGFWEAATLVDAAVIADDWVAANDALAAALGQRPAPWQLASLRRSLSLHQDRLQGSLGASALMTLLLRLEQAVPAEVGHG